MTDSAISSTANPVKTHIQLGHDLKLFFFDPVSPGSCFFLPHGFKIHSKLIKRIQAYYKFAGYQEVITPLMFEKQLWITSGHWDKYRDNMFLIQKEHKDVTKSSSEPLTSPESLEAVSVSASESFSESGSEYSLKPMNCCGHCLMFNKMGVSHKQLPLRIAEFGVLHRNEASGALRGLTRVRKFQQDDSHIFCKLEHVEGEIVSLLSFIDTLYKEFNLEYKLELSTRPENFIGNIENWNKAEEILKDTIVKFLKKEPIINEGDGAFYGPKIDISMKDSLNRWNQCATIQLDFNLPERFKLGYLDYDQTLKQPVMIHRALLGSLERFIAIILEHTQGYLPFWLSPRQIIILALKPEHVVHANQVRKILLEKFDSQDLQIDLDDSSDDLRNKIKAAEVMKYNFVLVIGDREVQNNSVSIRTNEKGVTKEFKGEIPVEKFLEFLPSFFR